ncbi:MAG: hypothetical protein J6B89_00430 [Bacilli bacterium]|nr:hypothetical protein [Bacilli bacterium]
MKYIKNNKLSIFVYLFLLLLIFASFYKYFKDYYSYAPYYYDLEEKCESGNKKSCIEFEKKYKYVMDPREKFKQVDTITLASEIIETSYFSILQWIAPLIIIILVVDSFHRELSSGIFKYYLNRMTYKKYLKRLFFISLKVSWVLPVCLLLVFLISGLLTGFNFSITDYAISSPFYYSFKYNNFIIYEIVICILIFLMSLLYGNLTVICSKKNKNGLITIVISYIAFLMVDLFIYVVFYALILNQIIGITNMTDYFNITGYWFFDNDMNYILLILIALLITFTSYVAVYFSYRSKEKLIYENEKQNS